MFCAHALTIGGTEGVRSRFHGFALPNSFSVVPRASGSVSMVGASGLVSTVPTVSGPVFMFRAPGLVFGITAGVGPVFMFCAPGLIFGCFEGTVSRFHVLRSRTYFRQFRGRSVPFSSFAPPDSFSKVPSASAPVFMFRAPDSFSAIPKVSGPVFIFSALGLIFDGTEGVGYRFPVLRSLNLFRWYQGRRVPFLCFALPDSFSALPRASDPFFMFGAPGLVFGGAEGVGSRFHVLLSRTRFWRYRGRRLPSSCFARPFSFSAEPLASFLLCSPVLVFGGTEGDGYRFLILRARTHFR
jgi:hypothetical protein